MSELMWQIAGGVLGVWIGVISLVLYWVWQDRRNNKEK